MHLHAGSSFLFAQLLGAVAGAAFGDAYHLWGGNSLQHSRLITQEATKHKPKGKCLLPLVQVLSQLLGSCTTL